MNLIKKLKSKLGKPEAGLPEDHEHDIFELPCDMGRKVLRMCTTKGCDFTETVAATEAQQEHVAPLTKELSGLFSDIEDEVNAELRKRGQR